MAIEKLVPVKAEFLMADETLLGVYKIEGPDHNPLYLVEVRCARDMAPSTMAKLSKEVQGLLAERYGAGAKDFMALCCTEGMEPEELKRRLTEHYQRAAASC